MSNPTSLSPETIAQGLTAILSLLAQLTPTVLKLATDLHQNAELSPESAKALTYQINNLSKSPAWQIEPDPEG